MEELGWSVVMFRCRFSSSCNLFFPFLSFAFILFLNLPMKSTLAMGNYNEQLHMTAPPAAKIRHSSTAYTHTHTHTAVTTSAIPYLISIVTEQPPSAQFSPNLLRKQYWYFTTVHNEEWGGGEGGRRKGLSQDRWRRRAQEIKIDLFAWFSLRLPNPHLYVWICGGRRFVGKLRKKGVLGDG